MSNNYDLPELPADPAPRADLPATVPADAPQAQELPVSEAKIPHSVYMAQRHQWLTGERWQYGAKLPEEISPEEAARRAAEAAAKKQAAEEARRAAQAKREAKAAARKARRARFMLAALKACKWLIPLAMAVVAYLVVAPRVSTWLEQAKTLRSEPAAMPAAPQATTPPPAPAAPAVATPAAPATPEPPPPPTLPEKPAATATTKPASRPASQPTRPADPLESDRAYLRELNNMLEKELRK